MSSVLAASERKRRLSRKRALMRLSASAIPILLGGCQTHLDLPSGQEAYTVLPSPVSMSVDAPTTIAPGDIINVTLYREADMTFENIRIDPSGHFSYPFLGQVTAAGKTPEGLSAEMAQRLGRWYTKPDVIVTVKQSSLNTVTVIGSVTEPGKFKMDGPTTLLDAVALAKGFTRIADQKQVVILRQVDGHLVGALFDMRQIQRGEAPDPRVLGNDKVVVGINHLEAAWRDALLATPLLGVFTPLYSGR